MAGLVSGLVALGIGELAAGLRSSWRSPVVGVADGVIQRVPNSVKDFAIEQFGKNDKVALVVGILVLSVVFAMVLGLVAARHLRIAMGGFAAFALVGVWGSQQSSTATMAGILPSLVAGVAGVVTLSWLIDRSPSTRVAGGDTDVDVEPAPVEIASSATRRVFLASAAACAVVAASAAAGGRALRSRFSAAGSRADVVLPNPAEPLPLAPPAVGVSTPGVSTFYTSNADFYRIDTAVEVPQIIASDWDLRIHGMVDRELRFTFDDLLKRRLVEHDITLTCVSNTVGGDLVGTARWLGIPLRELLDEAGVDPAADQLVGRSSDGWTSGFPLEALADERPALLAIGMNGEPLPLEHGFPARVIVSGIYGYVSATKWITELEVTTFDDFDAYWVKRGWDDRAPIKIQTRIDTPRTLQKLTPGTVDIGGVAWAQTIGISKVEVQIDDGPFTEATLADELNIDTWRIWTMKWQDATPGRHRITVRSTDAAGTVQTEERADPFPNGASGWMSILVQVEDSSA